MLLLEHAHLNILQKNLEKNSDSKDLSMEEAMPKIYQELTKVFKKLEKKL